MRTEFKLQYIETDQFFREWQDNIPEVSESEKSLVKVTISI